MFKKRLLWQLYPTYLLIIVLSLGTFAWYAALYLRDFYLEQTSEDLEARAQFVVHQVSGRWTVVESPWLDELCKELGRSTSTRITLILPTGEVLGDSDKEIREMDNHGNRPEVRQALSGNAGSSIRFSDTLKREMMYLAIPVQQEGSIRGVVRTAIPITSVERVLGQVRSRIFLGMFLIALLAAITSWVVSRRISRPLRAMKRGAERFARGQLDYTLGIPDSGEIGGLAVALNRMASQLKERIETIVQQRNEQEALLASMVESVLAVDTNKRILSMNQAAADLLSVNAEESKGRRLQEVIRDIDLQAFVDKVLTSQGTVEEDLQIYTDQEQYLQAHGTLLRDVEGREIGILVVLNDMTRLRRLENVRRDFFANVTHELRTPITSIKGYVETLRDGATHKPEDARRFLEIIDKQSDRLSAMIEDLLDLSRIEQKSEQGEIELHKEKIIDVLRAAVQTCEIKAAGQGVTLELNCEPEIQGNINARLLEQAVQNLIDNAIKYSDQGSHVTIEADRSGSEIAIRVSDRGVGIARENIPRLFERFYRVDKARSRQLGGTGLGLAIVKHIVQAHSGRITVESVPGRGSTFTIFLSSI